MKKEMLCLIIGLVSANAFAGDYSSRFNEDQEARLKTDAASSADSTTLTNSQRKVIAATDVSMSTISTDFTTQLLTACNTANTGNTRYVNNEMQYCNGVNWVVTATNGSAGGGATSTPPPAPVTSCMVQSTTNNGYRWLKLLNAGNQVRSSAEVCGLNSGECKKNSFNAGSTYYSPSDFSVPNGGIVYKMGKCTSSFGGVCMQYGNAKCINSIWFPE